MNVLELLIIIFFLCGLALGYVFSPYIDKFVVMMNRVVEWRQKRLKKNY